MSEIFSTIFLKENLILWVKYTSKAEPLYGRVEWHPKHNQWYLSTEEFYGHSYLDTPLTPEFTKDMIVLKAMNGEKL